MSTNVKASDQAARWIVGPALYAFEVVSTVASWVVGAISIFSGLLGILIYSKTVALLGCLNVVNRHTVGRSLEINDQERLVLWINRGWIHSHTPTYVYAPRTAHQSCLLAGALQRARSKVVVALLARMPSDLSTLTLEITDDDDGKKKNLSPMDLLYLGFGAHCIIEQGFHPKGAVPNGRVDETEAWRRWLALRAPIQEVLLENGARPSVLFEKEGTPKHRELFLLGQAKLLSLATQKCDASTVSRTRL